MRFLFFCDEATMPYLVNEAAKDEFLVCVAHNRPAAISLAQQNGVPHIVQPRVSSTQNPLFVQQVRDFRPDLVVSMSYGLKIPKSILCISRLGGINFHGGLLPEWRGANIVNWVLIEGATETGVTAHWLTPNFDEGPIISRIAVRISDTDTALTLSQKLGCTTKYMYRDVVSQLKRGLPLPSVLQDNSRSRYFRRRTPEDGEIDWSRSDMEIHNLIRALVHPWPGAFTKLRDGRQIVFPDYVPINEISALRELYSNT